MRTLAPAGTPLGLGMAAQAFLPDRNNRHFDDFKTWIDKKHVHTFSSARAALAVLLQTLHAAVPDRNEVAIPAYTCFSVAAAVVRAGLRPVLVDVSPASLDLDPECLFKVSKRGLLAVISPNLLGLPSDLELLNSIARACGAFSIDDAAQSLGGRFRGSLCGTQSDFGLFSLGWGKPLPAPGGGVLVTNRGDISERLDLAVRHLPPTSSFVPALKTLAYSTFLAPSLYWIPNSLPFLGLGTTEYDPEFTIKQMSRLSTRLLLSLFTSLEPWRDVRRANALSLRELLPSGFQAPQPHPEAQPVFLRFPVIAPNRGAKESVVDQINAKGLGASRFYPSALSQVPALQRHLAVPADCPQAEAIAARLFTLPTHAYVTRSDVEQIAQILASHK